MSVILKKIHLRFSPTSSRTPCGRYGPNLSLTSNETLVTCWQCRAFIERKVIEEVLS